MTAHKKQRVRLNQRTTILLGFILVFASLGTFMLFNSRAAVVTNQATFENGDTSACTGGTNTTAGNSSFTPSTERAYEGSYSAKASFTGGTSNAYARCVVTTNWTSGDDVWYGAAFYLPVGFTQSMQQQVDLMRWDNFSLNNASQDWGGIIIQNGDKLARLKRFNVNNDFVDLSPTFTIPEGRWVWLEVRQKFSATNGQAINEVYMDNNLIGSSTTANMYGRDITRIRYGLVAIGAGTQTNPLDLWVDRATVSQNKTGALQTSGSLTANLWVDSNGGNCSRQASAGGYSDTAACASFQAAWSTCQPGDTIIVKSSATTYGAQSITGTKSSPGCTIVAEAPDSVTVSSLSTNGGFLTIKDITVDVGLNGKGGWSTGSNVTAINLKLHGGEPSASIQGVTNVTWDGGELGQSSGGAKARDFCNGSDEPVTIASSSSIKVKHVTFWPQITGTNNACNHMENFRIDGTSATPTNDILLDGNFFKPGDGSNTSRIFITATSSSWAPTNIKIQNNYFGGQATAYDIDVHNNVTSCSTFTVAYNTLLGGDNAIQCSDYAGMQWIGNAGGKAGSACRGIFTKNVWVNGASTACSSDKWVSGNAYSAASALGVDANGDISSSSPAKDAAELTFCTSANGLNSLDRYLKTRPVGTLCDAGSMEFGASTSGGGGSTTCPTKQGDTNNDNAVNILDISAILSAYGQTNTTSCIDVTKDGNINIQDLSLVLSKYGT